ncbi:MAG: hypothetical protein K1X85_05630 [Ignavibacteria bacterium]|nr:hypothetical protein [Ignavibacteria bacterium]
MKQYLDSRIGITSEPKLLDAGNMKGLPMYLAELYRLFEANLLGSELILAEQRNHGRFSVELTQRQLGILQSKLEKNVVLVAKDLTAFQRKKFIDKGVSFIVPGKQMYLPQLLFELNEVGLKKSRDDKASKLIPSAQFLIIFQIFNHDSIQNIEKLSLKEVAGVTGYSSMAITKAAAELKRHYIAELEGKKEKRITFRANLRDVWKTALEQELLIDPVYKRVFAEDIPHNMKLLKSGYTALSDYTNLNPGNRKFFALYKDTFYDFKKRNELQGFTDEEDGECIELWKYDPQRIAGSRNLNAVDPLSLYLSLLGDRDERVRMESEKLIDEVKW